MRTSCWCSRPLILACAVEVIKYYETQKNTDVLVRAYAAKGESNTDVEQPDITPTHRGLWANLQTFFGYDRVCTMSERERASERKREVGLEYAAHLDCWLCLCLGVSVPVRHDVHRATRLSHASQLCQYHAYTRDLLCSCWCNDHTLAMPRHTVSWTGMRCSISLSLSLSLSLSCRSLVLTYRHTTEPLRCP